MSGPRFDLARFPLSAMIASAADIRRAVLASSSLDAGANVIVDHLYERLADDEGVPGLVLARFFRTVLYDDLPEDLQAFARSMAPGEELEGRRCLTLRATRGLEPDWNDVERSEGHRALPLISTEAVARSPMIHQLIRQLGVDTAQVVSPDPALLVDLAQRTYNVFHVADAEGSPHVPAQGFVTTYDVRSVLGFGGMLPNGDLFATILFSRVPIGREVADRFRTVSLAVKASLLTKVTDTAGEDSARTQLAAVRELLDAHEATALDQARALEQTGDALQRLARSALVVTGSLDVEELLPTICEQARVIVPAHQSVVSLTVGDSWEQSISAVSMSEKYAGWEDWDVQPDGSGIYRLVCEQQRPFRMTQEELEQHPAWRAFGEYATDHPPMRGWLAAPLIGREGQNLGLIQVSDRVDGEFSAEDEAFLVQLAQLASAALENARLASLVAHEEAARSREEMLAGLSHDMKTPLAVISGLAATFSLDPDAPLDERVEGYAALSRQSKRLRVLVQRFLDYSALEAGRHLHITPRPIDVRRTVQAVASLFRDHRQIEVEIPGDVPVALADDDRFEQALANLVSNAIKFSADDRPVTLRVSSTDEHVQVSVADQGTGIDPGELPDVWHKFRRGSNARGTDGSGLGLYISRAVIEAQGGSITATSTRNVGSEFVVKLRRADAVA